MLLEVRNLTRSFGSTLAVDNISFTLRPGEVIGFVGPNGSGKTTTMSIMATLDVPTSGDVLLDGKSILDYPEEARRHIGFMPDEIPNITDITAHEYIDFFGRAFGLTDEALTDAVNEVETFTGVTPLRDKTLSSLSKGMKQRVALARALVHNPDILLMDEPANGLDPRARVELRELVKLLAEHGKTIFLSSHILTELSEMCSSVIILEQGRLVSSGALTDVAQQSQTAADLHVSIRALGLPPAELAPLLLETPGVSDVGIRGPNCLATLPPADTQPPDERLAATLSSLLSRGIQIVEFHTETVNLEDVFLTMTSDRVS